jgi:hypothetical protein
MPVSEQVSGTHGRAEDDAIKRQDRSELQSHGEQWPEAESAGETATWAVEGRFAGTLPGEDFQAIELRSDLARHLDRTTFPADRGQVLQTLAAHEADDRLVELVSSLPDGPALESLSELLTALGLPAGERPA